MSSALQFIGITSWVLRADRPKPNAVAWINVQVQSQIQQKLLNQLMLFITTYGYICTQEKPEKPSVTINLPNLEDLLNNPQRKKQVYLECLDIINPQSQKNVDLP